MVASTASKTSGAVTGSTARPTSSSTQPPVTASTTATTPGQVTTTSTAVAEHTTSTATATVQLDPAARGDQHDGDDAGPADYDVDDGRAHDLDHHHGTDEQNRAPDVQLDPAARQNQHDGDDAGLADDDVVECTTSTTNADETISKVPINDLHQRGKSLIYFTSSNDASQDSVTQKYWQEAMYK